MTAVSSIAVAHEANPGPHTEPGFKTELKIDANTGLA